MKIFTGIDDLARSTGERLGPTPWITLDQSDIDQFAALTGDHQWVHVDTVRAASGPFASTIAHGHLVLSLVPGLLQKLYRVDNTKMGINYGLNRVRFITPVPSGSRLRATAIVVSTTELEGAVQVNLETTIELDHETSKPAVIAESITRYIAASNESVV
ncbi:MaoC family dehydratase [Rhodococcus opacus]|uniref:MaoC family dehydratase n=1 Tax=Rhodococcus opacus TaxID=37919 RepID=UPI00146E1957|nr:MaoC family dehydratase [Rhodococcus opacus]MDV7088975.1 MaoC family dehydratase [Rhodococcus opacus]WKN60261.1 MaoC family dehydratase [Rhodococcus opacus]